MFDWGYGLRVKGYGLRTVASIRVLRDFKDVWVLKK